MKNYIFVHSHSPLGVDLLELKKASGGKFWFIGDVAAVQALSQEELLLFETVWQTEDFSFEAVAEWIRHEIRPRDYRDTLVIPVIEFHMELCARLTDAFASKGDSLHQIKPFLDKLVMKKIAEDAGLRIPRYKSFVEQEYTQNPQRYLEGLTKYLEFPLIAKPIDSACSLGVEKIGDFKQLQEWSEHHDKDLQYEIDEFIEGSLFHLDAITHNGKILWTGIAECTFPAMQYMTHYRTMGSITLDVRDPNYAKLDEFHKQLLCAFKPPNGFTHAEAFVTPKGEVVFLEIAARPAGASAVALYKISADMNIREIHLRIKMGLSYRLPEAQKYYAITCFIPLRTGKVTALYEPELFSPYQLDWLIKPDEVINDTQHIADKKAAIIKIYNKDYADLRKDFETIRYFKFYDVM